MGRSQGGETLAMAEEVGRMLLVLVGVLAVAGQTVEKGWR